MLTHSHLLDPPNQLHRLISSPPASARPQKVVPLTPFILSLPRPQTDAAQLGWRSERGRSMGVHDTLLPDMVSSAFSATACLLAAAAASAIAAASVMFFSSDR